MAFPKVAKSGMAVPTGPTGILSSSRGGSKAGGKLSLGRGAHKGVSAPRGRKLAMRKGR